MVFKCKCGLFLEIDFVSRFGMGFRFVVGGFEFGILGIYFEKNCYRDW